MYFYFCIKKSAREKLELINSKCYSNYYLVEEGNLFFATLAFLRYMNSKNFVTYIYENEKDKQADLYSVKFEIARYAKYTENFKKTYPKKEVLESIENILNSFVLKINLLDVKKYKDDSDLLAIKHLKQNDLIDLNYLEKILLELNQNKVILINKNENILYNLEDT